MASVTKIHQDGKAARTLPIFRVAGNKELWELGNTFNWDELANVLKPLVSDDFWVESPEEEDFVDDVRGQFDRSKGNLHYGVVHTLINDQGGDNGILMQSVLSVGVHPDLPSSKNWRPSHICGCRARPNCAAAIAACRPDTSKKNENSKTLLEAAKETYTNENVDIPHWKECRPKVAVVFEKLVTKGPMTIAQLASHQKWWAVKNLVRRKVVSEAEMFEKFQGRDAIEWANHHGKQGMARELNYYFNIRKKLLPLTQVVSAIQPGSSFDSAKKSFGEAIVQLEPVKALVGNTEASVCQVKTQLDALDERSMDIVSKQEQRFQEMEKMLTRLDGRVKSLEEENKNLERENKMLAVKVQSMEEKQVQTETELDSKVNDKVKEFKKLFEDLGESVLVVEGKTEEELGRVEEKLEELKTQQRKELKTAVKELEGDMKDLEDKLDGFRSDAKKKMRSLGKELEKLKKGGEDESSSGGEE